MPASSTRAARDGARGALGRPSFTGSSMALESGAIVGIERCESNVGKPGPQQGDEIEARPASAVPEELAHQALRPVPPNRPSDPARRDDPQPAPIQTVRKREQNEMPAVDAHTPPLHTEKLPSAPDSVEPGEIPIHVCAPTAIHGSARRPLFDPELVRPRPSRDRPAPIYAAQTSRKPKGASAPWPGAASGLPCRSSCSCACGIRGSACAAGCSADTCVSCSHPRDPSRRAHQTRNEHGSHGTGRMSTKPEPSRRAARGRYPVVVVRLSVVDFRPGRDAVPPPHRYFPQGVEKTVDKRHTVAMRIGR